MSTRDFTREELDELGVPYEADAGVVLHTEQIGSGRWESHHEVVFCAPDDGKTWRVNYSEGLTEYQEADLWSYDDVITATEVKPKEITTTIWVVA